MCSFHQLLGRILFHPRQRDLEFDLDTKALGNLADADRTFDLGIRRYGNLLLAGDKTDCAQEASGISGGKKLLGVQAIACAASQPH